MSPKMITEFQNDRQLWQFNGLISGRLKVWTALVNPNEIRMIAI